MTTTINIQDDFQYCRQSGFDMMEYESPYSLNLANANFSTLWCALGFDAESDGRISPVVVLQAIKELRPELLKRETVIEGNYINMGIDDDRINRYKLKLTAIAHEAIRRKKLVIWG